MVPAMTAVDIPQLTPELVARMDEVSSDREAYRVQPGWWVASRNDDDTRVWSHVRMVMLGVHVPTQQKVVHIFSEDPTEPDVRIEMAAYHHQFVLCLNKAEVKRLGLADAK
jgi:hypothetical protein